MAEVKEGFVDEAIEKLKEIGWFVAVALLRWLLEQVIGGNPGEGEGDAETKH